MWVDVHGLNMANVFRGQLMRKDCRKCGANHSLGPSNDEPDCVKVEMRATELAIEDDGSCNLYTQIEYMGHEGETAFVRYDEHGHIYTTGDIYTGLNIRERHEWDAGCLAAAIAAHEEDA